MAKTTRGSTLAAFLLGGLICAALVLSLHAIVAGYNARSRLAFTRQLVNTLGLTDIALFTEARYTRHRSMADLHSPFQDVPMAFEHFPSGSMIPPRQPLSGQLWAGKEGQ
jgi:hypothetical protein